MFFFLPFLAWRPTSTIFQRSSVISFACAMIHKHDKTLIEPCSLNKTGHVLTFDSHCTARIGSFSWNKWQRKYFCLICLIGFSLSTFRTCAEIELCFGSYLCRNIENSSSTLLFFTASWSFCWTLGLWHLLCCLCWTVHGRGVLFPEASLNPTVYHVVFLQSLQLGTTVQWRFAP